MSSTRCLSPTGVRVMGCHRLSLPGAAACGHRLGMHTHSLQERLLRRLEADPKCRHRAELRRAKPSIERYLAQGYSRRAIYEALVGEGSLTSASCSYRTLCRYVASHVQEGA